MQNMCNSSCRARELWSIVELFPLLSSQAEFFALQTLFHCHDGCAASWCVIAIPTCLSWMGLSFGLPFVPCCLLKWRLCGCCFCQDLLVLLFLSIGHAARACVSTQVPSTQQGCYNTQLHCLSACQSLEQCTVPLDVKSSRTTIPELSHQWLKPTQESRNVFFVPSFLGACARIKVYPT